MDIKEYILNSIDSEIVKKFSLTKNNFSITQEPANGDYTLKTFALAKEFHASPMVLGQEILEHLDRTGIVEKAEIVGGYINFFLNKSVLCKLVLDEILSKGEDYGKEKKGEGKTVCIDFSSINLAKYMHVGHLCTTVLGNVIRNIYNFFGYKTIALNYVGDYGTPFGKMVRAYQLWGEGRDLDKLDVDFTQDLYIKFCQEAEKDDGTLDNEAREIFARIEKRDAEVFPIYEKLILQSKKEAQRIYDLMGIKFDSWRGESYYSDKMDKIVAELNAKGLLEDSQGAKVVNLEQYDLGVSLILKSDGSTLYITRDLTACDDRFDTYHFDESLYVTDVSQRLHFSQFFKIMELLGRPYAKDLKHIYYGRISLPDGKIASRKGKQALIKDILDYSIEKTASIVKDNENLTEEEKEKIAKAVGVGAVTFSVLKSEKIKDVVFDIDEALNFDGDTSPYLQYTLARCLSIERKAGYNGEEIDYLDLSTTEGINLIKSLYSFKESVLNSLERQEPCLISRTLLDISRDFNKYYSSNRVIDDGRPNTSRLALVHATSTVLSIGLKLLGIEALDKM